MASDGLIFQQETTNSIIKNQENGYLAFGVNGAETNLVIAQGGNVGVNTASPSEGFTINGAVIRLEGGVGVTPFAIANNNSSGFRIYDYTAAATRFSISTTGGIINATSRANFLGATDNALFSLNSGGTLYTVGFSPTATASSTNTLTLTTGTTTWIYTGTGTATWTLPNPTGNNQIYWIKNAGTGAITLTAFSGTNIINNSAASVSTISIAVGATAVIAQDGNVKSYQLQ